MNMDGSEYGWKSDRSILEMDRNVIEMKGINHRNGCKYGNDAFIFSE